jgi:hypothetical protein
VIGDSLTTCNLSLFGNYGAGNAPVRDRYRVRVPNKAITLTCSVAMF